MDWAMKHKAMDHAVKLMPAKAVRPFVNENRSEQTYDVVSSYLKERTAPPSTHTHAVVSTALGYSFRCGHP